MIITRAPLRIPLGGGGTDLPSYYQHRGGSLISAAVNKYIYITVNRRFESSTRISYSKTEIVDNVDAIEHPIVREALRLLKISDSLEITSIADIPASTGMGSSSCFTVALLLALHTYKREHLGPQALAEEAYHIERDILNEPVGKQDQYLAAFGGVVTMDIARDGKVDVGSVALAENALDDFESNLLLFYTGIRRSASAVLKAQDTKGAEAASDVTARLDRIREIGDEIRAAINAGDVRRFGEMMDVHWQTKKKLSGGISTSEVDRWYDLARSRGALGGKLMGAGGGGFLLLYCDSNKKDLRQTMAEAGLREIKFHIDWDGAKVVANL
jgi:D-glycero-alpha-D-manno-heptose-7-phosphate kinase